MSDALNYLEKTTNQIKTMITNPTSLTYGCIGISTIVLGYYTFFKSDGDKSEPKEESESVAEEPAPVVEEPAPAEEPVAEQPVAEEPQEEQTGGKSRKKSTKKQKHKNKNKKILTRRHRR